MTESFLQPPRFLDAPSTPVPAQVRGLVWKIAVATLILMAIGSATRVANAGLACPDWPLCYGQLVPSQQMNLQVFLEWFHRLDAGFIGLSTLGLLAWTVWERHRLPGWLPWASAGAVLLVMMQALLGALTVTEMLRFDIVTMHLGTALLFFAALLSIAVALTPFQGSGATGRWLAIAAPTATGLVYVQSLLGGLVASRWAVHQCLGGAAMCAIVHSHLLGVIPATVATGVAVGLAWNTPGLHPWLRRLATAAAGLVVLQILLGLATMHLHLQVESLTVAHQTIGALLLGVLLVLSLLVRQDRALAAG
ncbi:uncharacterized protein required for cytochrome oxidase assembly [Rubidibacter lacunae KORDI 51-2]|uniref:Uncharacterized protein required for cytochrome oxidase assembly n=1 Tax=Rubidibacter lacunae KORDI 51-2 TaxID=582515 RepID=U5DMC1_9CHRO|nr:heme A synthase [Rubidibacter lacunae]ERN41739.1 uncharacterized protein required for cytochrome oxidase assembly [Rubidibacter lacunae KORDI 51-2]